MSIPIHFSGVGELSEHDDTMLVHHWPVVPRIGEPIELLDGQLAYVRTVQYKMGERGLDHVYVVIGSTPKNYREVQ